jgi:tetratricopeptide (TPR) repeat protein
MKCGAYAMAAGLGLLLLLGGCSRHKQEAVKLANNGDMKVEVAPNEAIQDYEQAVQLDPTNHLILYKLAKAYKKKEEYDKVASTLARATDVAPSFANYWFERGHALFMQAEKKSISFEDCKEPFKKCVEADPNRDECYYYLARAELLSDNEQNAVLNYNKSIEFRPDNIDYYTRLADLYIRLGYEKEAEGVLNAAKEMANPSKDKLELYNAHTLLAGIFRDRGEIDKMVKEFEAAKAVYGEDAGILFNLGMGYAKLKPPKKAEALQMLKGFTQRACKSQQANKYKSECEQASAMTQKLSGPGS